MNEEQVKALAANVNSLIENYQAQQQNTAKLFEVCLEFLEDKQTGHEWGGGMKLAIAAAKKRKERKQELIAAVKGFIKLINERENKHE